MSGLLIDQTRTLFGREFFRHFSTAWGEPQTDFQYNLVVREIPDARWGSMIIIDVNGREVYRKRLAPRSGDVEQEVEKALPRVRRNFVYLMRADEAEAPADFKGEGY